MNTDALILAYLVAMMLTVGKFYKLLRYQILIARLLIAARNYQSAAARKRQTLLMRRNLLVFAISPLALAAGVQSAKAAGLAWMQILAAIH